jgi:hypothetical protein
MIRLTVEGVGMAPTLNTDQAAELYGVDADTLRGLLARGEAPVEPLRFGTRLRWPTAAVLRSLALDLEVVPQ